MSALARVTLVLHLVACCSCLEGDTCLKSPEKCPEVTEDDVDSIEDADAIAADVSLMQKDVPRLQRSLLQSKNIGRAGHWRSLLQARTNGSAKDWPSQSVRCNQDSIRQTQHMTFADYDDVVAQMQLLYNSLDTECSGDYCPQSDWAGCLLRLAAHDFMDYTPGRGGADGCLYLPDEDNKGLSDCLDGGSSGVGLLDAYSVFCDRISLADFIVIGAEAVMNITRQNVLSKDPSRQPLEFRSRFKYGRVTSVECQPSIGKMPDAERGCDAVKETLIDNLGLTWDQSAALMGAHTLGEASTSRSGYNGRWKQVQQSLEFDNGYYVSLLLKGWGPEKSVGGNDEKNQWKRVDVGGDVYRFGHEMMLDTDMCLYHTPYDFEVEPNPLHASTASTSGCNCAWVRPLDHMDAIRFYNNHEFCGCSQMFPGLEKLDFGTTGHQGIENANTLNFTKQRQVCCGLQEGIVIDPKVDCGLPNAPKGKAAAAVALFARDEAAWLKSYYEAWHIATTNGFTSLTSLSEI